MTASRLAERTGAWIFSLAAVAIGFAAFQVFGTAVIADRAQQGLAEQFRPAPADPSERGFTLPDIVLPDADIDDVTVPDLAGRRRPTVSVRDARSFSSGSIASAEMVAELGAPVAQLEIPSIDVDLMVVLGDRRSDLAVAPGVSPLLAAPGSADSNVVIAGHRTTHGSPFRDIDDLSPGSTITLTTLYGVFEYEVTGQEIIEPDDETALVSTEAPQLTLYTCHPEFSTRERLVVTAEPAGPVAEFPIRFTADAVPEPDLRLERGRPTFQKPDDTTVAAPGLSDDDDDTSSGEPTPEIAANPSQVSSPASSTVSQRVSAQLDEVYAPPALRVLPLAETASWSVDRDSWLAVVASTFAVLVFWRVAVALWAGGGRLRRGLSASTAVVAVVPLLIWCYSTVTSVTPVGF